MGDFSNMQQITAITTVRLKIDDALAFRWVLVNMAISFVVLMTVNMLERKAGKTTGVRQNAAEE